MRVELTGIMDLENIKNMRRHLEISGKVLPKEDQKMLVSNYQAAFLICSFAGYPLTELESMEVFKDDQIRLKFSSSDELIILRQKRKGIVKKAE